MRRVLATLALAGAGLGIQLIAQDLQFIHPEFLGPQFAVPPDSPSHVVIASSGEPGERLVVTGRTLDGRQSVAGVSVFVFHTDAKGVYATGMDNDQGEFHPRLHGALRTDADGRYEYSTIRPGSYRGGPEHVHYVVSARGYKPLLLALQFADDPIVVEMRRTGKPLLDPIAFRDGPANHVRTVC